MTTRNFRTWTMAALCGSLCALAACSSNFVKPGYDFHSVGKIAVLVAVDAGSPAQRQAIADMFAVRALQDGYDVMDRAGLADLGHEAAFQTLAGITGPEGRAKLAAHKVSAVIVCDVHLPIGEHWRARYGYADEDEEEVVATAKMWQVPTGALLWAGKGTLVLDGLLEDYGIAVAEAAAAATRGEKPVPVIGGISGAPATALQPNLLQVMQSVIGETCAGLPLRTPAGKSPAPR